MKLTIKKSAWDKIMAYTMLTPGEISGLGKVQISGDAGSEEIVVSDVAIFRQTVSGAHSTIPTAALAEFQTERVQAGESMKQWCFWWHSHANMAVFFSQTDTTTIEGSTEFPYLVSLVVNKKREWKARLDVHNPVNMYLELDVEILEEDNEALNDLCQKEIDEKVSTPNIVTWNHAEGNKVYNTKQKAGFNPERSVGLIPFDEEGWDVGSEWQAHKHYLIAEIKEAKRKGQTSLMQTLKQELQEHFTWGKSQGLTVSSE